jgi:hypothetical protein
MFLIRWLQWLGQRVDAHFSPLFERLDASAETIWPKVPEEAEPPRWRLDPLPESEDRGERLAAPSCVRPGDRVGILHA